MAKVEGMRGKDNLKPVFIKKGAPNIAPTFRNNNINNNNKSRMLEGMLQETRESKWKVGSWQKTANSVINQGIELKNAGRSSGRA
ncbi:hypothetical protein Taro_044744 [Colocasia esculenta]|uniref:Uncharacterized protein n=1 Tax=Colocasia esculenta TaxID=4460 RepID=A0A843WMN6_COLES|nr:hypothetical protein [Colocasia esculenta]